MNPRKDLDTNTNRLTNRHSQRNFDLDFGLKGLIKVLVICWCKKVHLFFIELA
jgi:hypothetical protein